VAKHHTPPPRLPPPLPSPPPLRSPVKPGLTRASERSAPDRFEQEQQSFFERVREAYLNRANNDPQHYRIIDAAQALDVVQNQIARALQDILAL